LANNVSDLQQQNDELQA